MGNLYFFVFLFFCLSFLFSFAITMFKNLKMLLCFILHKFRWLPDFWTDSQISERSPRFSVVTSLSDSWSFILNFEPCTATSGLFTCECLCRGHCLSVPSLPYPMRLRNASESLMLNSSLLKEGKPIEVLWSNYSYLTSEAWDIFIAASDVLSSADFTGLCLVYFFLMVKMTSVSLNMKWSGNH